MTKQALRKQFTEKRMALTQADYDDRCAKIFKEFRNLDFTGVRCLHIFHTIHARREPDTLQICNWLKANHHEITLVYPKTNFTEYSMQSIKDDASLQMGVNASGINEPVVGNEVEPGAIDMIVVPLLAFDRQGNRVGYGKGFYDRFIATCRPDVKLTGLSLFEPVDEITDVDGFDKKLTACVTPNNTVTF